MGQKSVVISVINGDKGWMKSNDMLVELDKRAILTQKEHAYFIELASLTSSRQGRERSDTVGHG